MKIIIFIIALIFSSEKILASDTAIIHGGYYSGNAYFNLSDYDRQFYIQGIIDGLRASELFDANSSSVHKFSDCMKNRPPSQLQAVVEKALRDAMDASLPTGNQDSRTLRANEQPSIRKESPRNAGGSSDGYGIKVPKA